jgi:FlaA1/EpsC-like NDP-sugar epimerase
VIPLFHDQIKSGGPVTITTPDMTRFLLSLDEAVDTVFAATREARRGETYIPRVPAVRVTDIAAALIGERPIEIQITGIRPGEKVHEILVSEEECHRTVERGRYYAIQSILPEIRESQRIVPALTGEYSSSADVLDRAALVELMKKNRLMIEDRLTVDGEFLA